MVSKSAKATGKQQVPADNASNVNAFESASNVNTGANANVDGNAQSVVNENVILVEDTAACGAGTTNKGDKNKVRALAVACFLDPRYKMKVVEFYYTEMSDDGGYSEICEFRSVVQELFDSYVSLYTNATPSNSQPVAGTSQHHVDDEPKRKRLSDFLKDNTEVEQEKSDFEKYCQEPLLKWPENEYFDILSWWKTHGVKYPILARLARDVLAIPVSTVASESAFSAGGRVVHKYRSRLDPEVVEALICTKDWVRASRKDESNIATIIDGIAALDINDRVSEVQAEGASSSATGTQNVVNLEDN